MRKKEAGSSESPDSCSQCFHAIALALFILQKLNLQKKQLVSCCFYFITKAEIIQIRVKGLPQEHIGKGAERERGHARYAWPEGPFLDSRGI